MVITLNKTSICGSSKFSPCLTKKAAPTAWYLQRVNFPKKILEPLNHWNQNQNVICTNLAWASTTLSVCFKSRPLISSFHIEYPLPPRFWCSEESFNVKCMSQDLGDLVTNFLCRNDDKFDNLQNNRFGASAFIRELAWKLEIMFVCLFLSSSLFENWPGRWWDVGIMLKKSSSLSPICDWEDFKKGRFVPDLKGFDLFDLFITFLTSAPNLIFNWL